MLPPLPGLSRSHQVPTSGIIVKRNNIASLAARSDDENGGAAPDWLPKTRYGFPVVFLETSGVNPSDEHVTHFSRSAMWGDIALTLFVSGVIGRVAMQLGRSHTNAYAIRI